MFLNAYFKHLMVLCLLTLLHARDLLELIQALQHAAS